MPEKLRTYKEEEKAKKNVFGEFREQFFFSLQTLDNTDEANKTSRHIAPEGPHLFRQSVENLTSFRVLNVFMSVVLKI